MDILIIDDDPFVSRLLDLQLRNLQIKARGFGQMLARQTGEAALALLGPGSRVGLVFCDLQMPGMDGVALVEHLVEIDYPGALVLITGEDVAPLQSAARLARAHRLQLLAALQKPVSPGRLQQLLDGVLRRSETGLAPTRDGYGAEELRAGLAAGQLLNHYQPKVDLGNGNVVGFEVLVRWQHPRDGLVLPGQFIGCSERHDLIGQLTEHVLDDALAQAKRWQKDALMADLSVNISAATLVDPDFPGRVAAAAARAEIALKHLVLEVPESQLMQDPMAPLTVLARLRLKQVGLSLDDFGSGYASLAQLRDLPFNELKLERGFLHTTWRAPELAAGLHAQLGMARRLRMRSVAKAIEDEQDWAYLRSQGCEWGQGTFIGEPMPAQHIDAWRQQWAGRVPGLVRAAS